MRLLTFFLMLLSVVAGLTLNKTDGTTIELGDEPTVVDLSSVIMPEHAPVTEFNVHNTTDINDVETADWDRTATNVHVYEHVNNQGGRTDAYLCREGMNSCLSLVDRAKKPTASSIVFKDCPDGAPNHGRKFHCFFYTTPVCDNGTPSLFARGSIANLANIGWNDKIRSVDCFWE